MGEAKRKAQLTSPPKCISINICESVIEDVRTHNKSLIGIFNQIGCFQFPARHPRFVLFVSLIDGRGKTPIVVEIAMEGEEPIVRIEGGVEWKNPLAVTDLVFDINGIIFKNEGPHYARIQTPSGDILGERRFLVSKVEMPKGGTKP